LVRTSLPRTQPPEHGMEVTSMAKKDKDKGKDKSGKDKRDR
jgi:hypothetical protein